MLSSRMTIYAATVPVDLRRSFDGLAQAAREHLGKDPQSGALFLFVNKSGDRLKALWWDRTGYCLLYKRLERGTFRLPGALGPGDTSVAIDAAECAKILEGLDLPKAVTRTRVTKKSAAPITAPLSMGG